MQNKEPCRQKKTKISTTYQILGCILAITCLAVLLVIKGTSFSSYKKTSVGSDGATVAKPIVTVSSSNNTKLVAINKLASIEFTVSNDDQANYSQTALQYRIQIEKSSSYEGNITYKLYESSDSGSTYSQVATGTNSLTCPQTEQKQLPAGAPTKHYFKLEYTSDSENYDQSLLDISVDSEQII